MPSTVVSNENAGVGAIDYTQDGVLWSAYLESNIGEVRFSYSTDAGESWNDSSASSFTAENSLQPVGFFIDKDNGAHVVYYGDGQVSYRHGQLNPLGTSWTWSNNIQVNVFGDAFFFTSWRVVAHREGSVWVAHVIYAQGDGSSSVHPYVTIIDINASHIPTVRTRIDLHNFVQNASADVAIDFHHEADDPKAVQGGAPHLYTAYAMVSGIADSLFYTRIAYSGGSWSAGTERTLDASNQYLNRGHLSLYYDGTRVVICHVRSASNTVVRVDERDEADTTTTNRDPTALSDGALMDCRLGYGIGGDIWLFAQGFTSFDYKKIRFNRGAGTWAGSWTVVEADNNVLDNYQMSMMCGISPTEASPVLGCLYKLVTSAPDQIRFASLASAWRGSAVLQAVATLSPDPNLGIAAQAALQGVATMSPTANLGLNPNALLQGVATMEGKGMLTPLQDYTVYDAYIDGLGIFGPSGLIYYEDEQTKKSTVSQQLRPARTDDGSQPTEVRPEQGEIFSQQDFSHGAGQLYYHHEGRDTKRYLWSEGFDVDIDTVGRPATLVHQNAVAQTLVSTAAGKIVVFNDIPFVIDGTSVKKFISPLPGSWTDDDPHAGESATTPQDLDSSGEYLYAALGANGIHRRNTSGAWAHWSAVQATRVAWVKNRIMATDGPSIYEVLEPGGAAPTPIETLPAGWAFESIFEVSGFVYATAVNRSSELSRIHAYKLNAAGTALEKRSETPFPRDQIIVAGSGYLDNVLLGGGIKTGAGGFDPVVYQAGVADQDTGALSYAKVAEGEGAGAADLSVKTFEARGEDVVFGWSLGSGFAFGARDGLALLKLKVGGFFPYLKTPGAGEGRVIESVTLWNGVLLFTVKGKGVYYQDLAKLIRDAYLVSSVADYQTTAKKVWDLIQVSHDHLPADTKIELDYSIHIPSETDAAWKLAITSDTDDSEIAEARFDDLSSRLLAVRIRSTANTGQTDAPSAVGFLVRSNLLPDTPEWNLTRYVRVLKKDVKDEGGEEVYLGNVQTTLRSIQQLTYRIVNLYEPGVKWTARIDRVADMTPFLPKYSEMEGEERQDVMILQLTMSGTRD